MATFMLHGVCYPNETTAKDAFLASFPQSATVSSNLVTFSATAATVNTAGLISYTQRQSNNGSTSSQTYQLMPCSSLSTAYQGIQPKEGANQQDHLHYLENLAVLAVVLLFLFKGIAHGFSIASTKQQGGV